MILQTFADIYSPELAKDAIINDEFQGFKEDYLVLHCLLRKFQPKSVWECGCNMGVGTKIICNAVPDAKVYSFDLPTELAHISLQHPISEGKGDNVGSQCNLPFELIRGDSLTFDFSQYPCEAYYIDSEHTEKHVTAELNKILPLKPKLVILHDTDIPEVMQGIKKALKKNKEYKLYRVTDTRISYLLTK